MEGGLQLGRLQRKGTPNDKLRQQKAGKKEQRAIPEVLGKNSQQDMVLNSCGGGKGQWVTGYYSLISEK